MNTSSWFLQLLTLWGLIIGLVNAWIPIRPGYPQPSAVYRRKGLAEPEIVRGYYLPQPSEPENYSARVKPISYSASHVQMKVPKNRNFFSSDVSATMQVADDPDAILDRGILVSRKDIRDWLREEAQKENGFRPEKIAVSQSRPRPRYSAPLIYPYHFQ